MTQKKKATCQLNKQSGSNRFNSSNLMKSLNKCRKKEKMIIFHIFNKIFVLSVLLWTFQFSNNDFLRESNYPIKYNQGNAFDLRTNRLLYEDSNIIPFNDDTIKNDVKTDNLKNVDITDGNITGDNLLNDNLKQNLTVAMEFNIEQEKIKLILYSYMDKIDSEHEDKLFYKLARKCRDEENYERMR
ncbi:conserved Plasmodium protein, unknown function [Plasmodium ovale]|uniref:Uncharacterized protein n=1 Tax=Plasmodium ovale TaxID=36330 RepID=A0A1C3KP08_PLAOA|nr:conserved Plasmodium protein, unknown function [Plasmodium ovale]